MDQKDLDFQKETGPTVQIDELTVVDPENKLGSF